MKHIKKRYIFYFLMVAFSIFIAFLPKLYDYVDPYKLTVYIEKEIKKKTGKTVLARQISFKIEKGFRVVGNGVVVLDERGKLIAKVDKIDLEIDPLEAYRKRLKIYDAEIEGLSVRIYRHKDRQKEKSLKLKVTKELISFLKKIDAQSVHVADLWLMVCDDPLKPFIDECFAAEIVKADVSVKGADVKLKLAGDVLLPYYANRFSVSGEFSTVLKIDDVDANANLSVHAPPLLLRDRWAELRGAYPETDGDIDFAFKGGWAGENIVADIAIKSNSIGIGAEQMAFSGNKIDLKANAEIKNRKSLKLKLSLLSELIAINVREKDFVFNELDTQIEASLDGKKLQVDMFNLNYGPKGKRMSASIVGGAEMAEELSVTGEKKIDFESARANINLKAEEASLVNEIAHLRSWPVYGAVEAEINVTAEKEIATAEIKIDGKNIRLDIPALYGSRPAKIKSAAIYSEFVFTTPEARIDRLDVKFDSSSVSVAGKIQLEDFKPKSFAANAQSQSMDYFDVKKIIPWRRLKTGSLNFFGEDLKSGKVVDVSGKLKWQKGWKSREFIENGLEVTGKIAEANIDFGNAPIVAQYAEATMSGGDIFFTNMKADVCGSAINSGKLDILSIKENPTLIVYLNERVSGESLKKFLSASRFKLGKYMANIAMGGVIKPAMTLKIPFREGAAGYVYSGKALLENATFSYAGVVPTMSALSGELVFSGLEITAKNLRWKVGKMEMTGAAHFKNMLELVAEMTVSTPLLLPNEYISYIPDAKTIPGQADGGAQSKVAITVELVAAEGKYRTLKFTNLETKMFAGGKNVEIRKLKFDVAQGLFRIDEPANIAYDGPAGKVKFSAKRLDPYRLMKIFGVKKEVVRGDMKMDGTIKFRGSDFDKVLASLNGRIAFDIADGTIEESNILLSAFDLANLDFSQWQAKKMGYRLIEGKLGFENGVMNIDQAIINGFFMKIIATGDIDLGGKKMEVDIGIIPLGPIEKAIEDVPIIGSMFKTKSGKAIIGYYFRVKGSLDNYKVIQLGPEGVREKLSSMINILMDAGAEEVKKPEK